MEWPEDTVVRLRELWSEGLSTAEIGRRLGVNKNAVVGKAHRLDLPPRPSPIRREGEPLPQIRARIHRSREPTLPPLSCIEALIRALPSPTPHGSQGTSLSEPAGAQRAKPFAMVRGVVYGPPMSPAPSRQAAEDAAAAAARRSPPTAPPPPASLAFDEEEVLEGEVIGPGEVVPIQPTRTHSRIIICCWPIGEPGTPGFRFCADPSKPGKPYCEEHARLAYVKVRDRREDAA